MTYWLYVIFTIYYMLVITDYWLYIKLYIGYYVRYIFLVITLGMKTFKLDFLAAAAAKSLQSCPTLCDPIDGSPPGFPVPEILQARTLQWVAISFSKTGLI